MAFLICIPEAQARNSDGEALDAGLAKWMSWNDDFPEPPPAPGRPGLLTPQLKDSTSMAPSWPLTLLSPLMPSISRRKSDGMCLPLLRNQCDGDRGCAVAA